MNSGHSPIEASATERVTRYLEQQSSIDTLRFITCGSVDDGKSTLIGRMLFEAKVIFDDQVQALRNDSKKAGTQGGDIDFALLVDGLAAEREQGITIDVAYRFFSTECRKFIVADTPGHEQYTRNMVTGASTADVAVILIDARQGVLDQTRRHSIICSSLGIQHVLITINKMDLLDYSQEVYQSIVADYSEFAKKLDFASINFVPVSALKGKNIVARAKETQWYSGPTLLGYLETVDVHNKIRSHALRLPVQWVNRPNSDFRGFSGTVEAGDVRTGQDIRILPSGETAKIKDIILYEHQLQKANFGQSVTVTFDREVDASRGDIIVEANSPCELSDHFEARLVWMDKEPGHQGRSYLMKIGNQTLGSQITTIKHKININTFENLSAQKLELNDLSVVNIKTAKPIAFESYEDCVGLGGFILIDRLTNQTVAAGMINFALRRAKNIHNHKHAIDKTARRRLNGHNSKVLWFTGLSGSGKSTVASALETVLHQRGIRTYILDGDNVRHGLNNDLGFTETDRIENIRRIAEVAKLMVDAGTVVLTAFISPFKLEREMARALFEEDEFVEIFVSTPLSVTEERDPKGLYKKARSGEIPNFTGIDSPYEEPDNPEITLNTVDKSVDELVKQIIDEIEFE